MSESTPIDVLIIGFGALGTIYGYILSQNANVRVTAIARSSYDAMSKGIRIESDKFGLVESWKPWRLVRDAEEANDRPYQYIIGCFKCLPDLLPSAAVLAPFLEGVHAKKDTDALEAGPTVVLIQNGIGIEHPVQVAYPDIPIISVVAWIGANLLPNAVVTHGMLENLVIGLYLGEGGDAQSVLSEELADPAGYKAPGGEERKAEGWRRTRQLESLLRNGGGGVEVVDDIQVKRYEKNIWNAAWSSMCTLSRAPLSAVLAPAVLPYTLAVTRRIMLEVLYVARECGLGEDVLPMVYIDGVIKITIQNYQTKSTVAQTPGTPFARGDAFGGYGFPSSASDASPSDGVSAFKPSMLLDVEAGRPCELEPIIGSLLDRARAKGIETPRLDMVYASLKVYQDSAVARSAQSVTYKEHIAAWYLRKPAVGGVGLAGRKQWERAIRLAEAEKVNGKKVTGAPVKVDDNERKSSGEKGRSDPRQVFSRFEETDSIFLLRILWDQLQDAWCAALAPARVLFAGQTAASRPILSPPVLYTMFKRRKPDGGIASTSFLNLNVSAASLPDSSPPPPSSPICARSTSRSRTTKCKGRVAFAISPPLENPLLGTAPPPDSLPPPPPPSASDVKFFPWMIPRPPGPSQSPRPAPSQPTASTALRPPLLPSQPLPAPVSVSPHPYDVPRSPTLPPTPVRSLRASLEPPPSPRVEYGFAIGEGRMSLPPSPSAGAYGVIQEMPSREENRGWAARRGMERRDGLPSSPSATRAMRKEATESLHSREASGSAETGETMSSGGTGGASSTVPTSVAVSERGRAGYRGAWWSSRERGEAGEERLRDGIMERGRGEVAFEQRGHARGSSAEGAFVAAGPPELSNFPLPPPRSHRQESSVPTPTGAPQIPVIQPFAQTPFVAKIAHGVVSPSRDSLQGRSGWDTDDEGETKVRKKAQKEREKRAKEEKNRRKKAGQPQEEEETEVLQLPEMEKLIAAGPRFSVGTIVQEMTTAAMEKIDQSFDIRPPPPPHPSTNSLSPSEPLFQLRDEVHDLLDTSRHREPPRKGVLRHLFGTRDKTAISPLASEDSHQQDDPERLAYQPAPASSRRPANRLRKHKPPPIQTKESSRSAQRREARNSPEPSPLRPLPPPRALHGVGAGEESPDPIRSAANHDPVWEHQHGYVGRSAELFANMDSNSTSSKPLQAPSSRPLSPTARFLAHILDPPPTSLHPIIADLPVDRRLRSRRAEKRNGGEVRRERIADWLVAVEEQPAKEQSAKPPAPVIVAYSFPPKRVVDYRTTGEASTSGMGAQDAAWEQDDAPFESRRLRTAPSSSLVPSSPTHPLTLHQTKTSFSQLDLEEFPDVPRTPSFDYSPSRLDPNATLGRVSPFPSSPTHFLSSSNFTRAPPPTAPSRGALPIPASSTLQPPPPRTISRAKERTERRQENGSLDSLADGSWREEQEPGKDARMPAGVDVSLRSTKPSEPQSVGTSYSSGFTLSSTEDNLLLFYPPDPDCPLLPVAYTRPAPHEAPAQDDGVRSAQRGVRRTASLVKRGPQMEGTYAPSGMTEGPSGGKSEETVGLEEQAGKRLLKPGAATALRSRLLKNV